MLDAISVLREIGNFDICHLFIVSAIMHLLYVICMNFVISITANKHTTTTKIKHVFLDTQTSSSYCYSKDLNSITEPPNSCKAGHYLARSFF